MAAAVLGSGLTLLDGTVVNVALRTIGRDLGASLSELDDTGVLRAGRTGRLLGG